MQEPCADLGLLTTTHENAELHPPLVGCRPPKPTALCVCCIFVVLDPPPYVGAPATQTPIGRGQQTYWFIGGGGDFRITNCHEKALELV